MAYVAIALLITGCGASVSVRATDAAVVDAPLAVDVGVTDLGVPVDVAVTDTGLRFSECRLPSDCGPSPMASVSWCPGSSWSCIDGQCAWECRGGRRCERAPDGCVRCDGEAREYCPGRDPCTPGWPDAGRIEEAFCARAWNREPSQCFGPWVRMNSDGTLCSLQSAFTGAPRTILTCRRCQTGLVGFEPQP